MDHFADDVMQKTSYNADSSRTQKSNSINDAELATSKVPALSTQDSEIIRSLWQRKQNNMSTILWLEIEGDPMNPVKAGKSTVLKRLAKMFAQYWIGLFPCGNWFRLLNKEAIKADIVAGFSVGMMIIPQSMSYANIAGLDVK
ncbi:MAG: hypothetical protein SGPRY_006980 [Prymnesium sp.]